MVEIEIGAEPDDVLDNQGVQAKTKKKKGGKKKKPAEIVNDEPLPVDDGGDLELAPVSFNKETLVKE
jgi:hypothetical protein